MIIIAAVVVGVKLKRIGNPNTSSENIQSGYRDGIWHRKICHANNEKRKTTNDRRNRSIKREKIRTFSWFQKSRRRRINLLDASQLT